MHLRDLFDGTFQQRASEPAIEYYDSAGALRVLSFRDVDHRARQMAAALQRRGFTKGDRLCVYLPNCIEMVDLYLACVRLGLIFVPINILYKDREFSYIVNDAEPREAIAAEQIVEIAAEAETLDPNAVEPDLDESDPAAIIYTSGTTGASKGAVLTHANFSANALNLNRAWRISPADRFLLALPLFHVHGLGNGLHCWITTGCRMRLLERFDHRTAQETFLDFQPTLFFGVPTIYVRLLEIPQDAARTIGSRMRLFVSGSAPLPAQVLEEFRARFGHTILERYGMTETLMSIGNPYEGERRPGSVGLPLPGVSVEIREGELYVRGANVFPGYWRRDDATRAAFTDGWFRTGDIAERSDDGYYTLQGRKSDLIISGGFNIYPREIEEFLLEQEEVAEAAVAGVPHQVRGEVPVAYVVCREGFEPDDLAGRCRAALASFKVPRRFVRVERLPRTALGKVQKHLLPVPDGLHGDRD
jgi:malonyl-CoA/methylmalonyl-CoA synthetase